MIKYTVELLVWFLRLQYCNGKSTSTTWIYTDMTIVYINPHYHNLEFNFWSNEVCVFQKYIFKFVSKFFLARSLYVLE